MLPFENEVQKATKTYMLILNIAFAAILLNGFIIAATFFNSASQMHMTFNNSIIFDGTPTFLIFLYAFLAAAIPATIAYIFLRLIIQNYGENLRQSYMMTKTETPIVETEDQVTEAK